MIICYYTSSHFTCLDIQRKEERSSKVHLVQSQVFVIPVNLHDHGDSENFIISSEKSKSPKHRCNNVIFSVGDISDFVIVIARIIPAQNVQVVLVMSCVQLLRRKQNTFGKVAFVPALNHSKSFCNPIEKIIIVTLTSHLNILTNYFPNLFGFATCFFLSSFCQRKYPSPSPLAKSPMKSGSRNSALRLACISLGTSSLES